ncbi:MAG: LysR family transcriptional regulator [Eggerthellaceae bacterium]|nr:LysR family transcriptional regulator [Eggerthellaceae bacterium]
MLDFRVRTFLTVCRTLNYTRAAEELNITQPAVSQHIAYLEREYGTPLFTYQGRRLTLTKAGQVLRDALGTMAHDETLLHERIGALAAGEAVELRIGLTLTAGEYVVAAPLASYLAEHPDIHATVRSGGTRQLLEQLDAGLIDCAFVEGMFDKAAYAWDAFCTERLACVCAAGHRFAAPPRTVDDLLGERLIVREEGSGTRGVLDHALAARNLSLDAFADTLTVESLDIIKVFVAQDLGISFLYEAAVQREVAEGSLREVPLAGPPVQHDISFVRLRGSAFEAETKALFKTLVSQRRQL